jgi:threonine dehydrogenase-like Zn-dependent dehydrogenase
MLGVHRNGAFAEYVAVPLENVLPVPQALSLWHAAFTEPVAAAAAVLKAPIRSHQRGLIFGENRIAELTRRILLAAGFEHIEMGSPTGHAQYDFVIETLATRQSLRSVVDLVKPNGCIVLKSRPFEAVPLDITACVLKDVTLSAVNYASFHDALDLMATGKVRVDDLFDAPAPLRDYEATFASARSGQKKHFFRIAS